MFNVNGVMSYGTKNISTLPCHKRCDCIFYTTKEYKLPNNIHHVGYSTNKCHRVTHDPQLKLEWLTFNASSGARGA